MLGGANRRRGEADLDRWRGGGYRRIEAKLGGANQRKGIHGAEVAIGGFKRKGLDLSKLSTYPRLAAYIKLI